MQDNSKEMIQSLITQCEQLKELDYEARDGLERRARMVIRQTFGNESIYLNELDDATTDRIAVYSSIDPAGNLATEKKIWHERLAKTLNVFRTMFEELKLGDSMTKQYRLTDEAKEVARQLVAAWNENPKDQLWGFRYESSGGVIRNEMLSSKYSAARLPVSQSNLKELARDGLILFDDNEVTLLQELKNAVENDFKQTATSSSPLISSANSAKTPIEMVGNLINQTDVMSDLDEAGINRNQKLALRLANRIFGSQHELTQTVKSLIYFDSLDRRKQELLTVLHEIQIELELEPYVNISDNQIFGEINQSKQFKIDAFMVMPFREKFLSIYTDNIAPTVQSLELEIKKGDDVFSKHDVLHDIWSLTNNAHLIIAECTEKNPNVYYEIGIAHTLDKPVIMIAQNLEDIPFDLQAKRVIVYENNPTGLKKLEQDLEHAIKLILGI